MSADISSQPDGKAAFCAAQQAQVADRIIGFLPHDTRAERKTVGPVVSAELGTAYFGAGNVA